jgi:hypothetical protein
LKKTLKKGGVFMSIGRSVGQVINVYPNYVEIRYFLQSTFNTDLIPLVNIGDYVIFDMETYQRVKNNPKKPTEFYNIKTFKQLIEELTTCIIEEQIKIVSELSNDILQTLIQIAFQKEELLGLYKILLFEEGIRKGCVIDLKTMRRYFDLLGNNHLIEMLPKIRLDMLVSILEILTDQELLLDFMGLEKNSYNYFGNEEWNKANYLYEALFLECERRDSKNQTKLSSKYGEDRNLYTAMVGPYYDNNKVILNNVEVEARDIHLYLKGNKKGNDPFWYLEEIGYQNTCLVLEKLDINDLLKLIEFRDIDIQNIHNILGFELLKRVWRKDTMPFLWKNKVKKFINSGNITEWTKLKLTSLM